jgi:hypothetical protein
MKKTRPGLAWPKAVSSPIDDRTRLAATNKSLAQMNKSLDVGKATKKR